MAPRLRSLSALAALAALAACAGVSPAAAQTRLPAANVVFDDAEDLQTKLNEGDLGGNPFTPDADPAVDHSGYVAGHADGANCPAGQYPLGVDASGAAEGCAEVAPGTFPVELYESGSSTAGFREAAAACAATTTGGVITWEGNKTISGVGLTAPLIDLPAIVNTSDAPHGSCHMEAPGSGGHGQVFADRKAPGTLYVTNASSMTAAPDGLKPIIRINGSGQRVEGFNLLVNGADSSVRGIFCQSPAGTNVDPGYDALTNVSVRDVKIKGSTPQGNGIGIEFQNCQESTLENVVVENFETGLELATPTCTDTTPADGQCDDDPVSDAPYFRAANNVLRLESVTLRANEVGLDVTGPFGCKDAAAYSVSTENNTVAGYRFATGSACMFGDFSPHHENASGSDNVLIAAAEAGYYATPGRYGGAATNDISITVARDAGVRPPVVIGGEFNNDVNVVSGADLVLYEPRIEPGSITGSGRVIVHDSTGAGVNVPTDTDGDGFPDFVVVRGDYNGDGSTQTDDVQAAVDALTDPESRHVFVDAGQFLAPTSGLTEAASGDLLDYDSLITLPSNTTLECSAWGRAVLHGIRFDDLGDPDNGQDVSFSVVGGDNSGGTGNSNIRILGCEIDGGLSQSYTSDDGLGTFVANSNRMGVRLHDCVDCEVSGNFVHDNFHSGIYFRGNSDRMRVLDNLLEDGGGYHDNAAIADRQQGQMRIYGFIEPGATADMEDIVIRGNVLRRNPAGIKLRVGDATATGRFKRATISGNIIEDALNTCVAIGGSEDTAVLTNRCIRTDSIRTETSTAFGDFQSNLRVTISGNVITDAQSETNDAQGIEVTSFHEDVLVQRNLVDGTESNCATFGEDVRGLDVSGTFRNCGAQGIEWSADNPLDVGTLHDFVVDGWGRASFLTTTANGLRIYDGCANKVIRNGTIKGAPRWSTPAVRSNNARLFHNCELSNLTIDHAPKNWIGTAAFASAPFNGTTSCTDQRADDWGIITDAAGTTTVGSGGTTRNVVYCDGTTWLDWNFTKSAAVTFGFLSATDNHSNEFRDITILNASASATGSDQDAWNFQDGAWTDILLDGIRLRSGTDLVGLEGPVDGVSVSVASGATAWVRKEVGTITCGQNFSASSAGAWTSNGGVCDATP